jgi:hypothetical protein
MKLSSIALMFLAAATPFVAHAHGPKDPPHQSHALGDLKLESGEVIRDFSISTSPTARSTPPSRTRC